MINEGYFSASASASVVDVLSVESSRLLWLKWSTPPISRFLSFSAK